MTEIVISLLLAYGISLNDVSDGLNGKREGIITNGQVKVIKTGDKIIIKTPQQIITVDDIGG